MLADSGRTLLPVLELLDGAQASIVVLMHETAVALVKVSLYEDSFVKPSLITGVDRWTSRAPNEGRHGA